MRVLDTETGRFVKLIDPSRVEYAILSHVWSEAGEQSYQDVVRIQESIDAPSLWRSVCSILRTLLPTSWFHDPLALSPRSLIPPSTIFAHRDLSSKIRFACAVARADGYRYLWIDSCCIDSTSSAELSEAINSMYKWYSESAICYVYLVDVEPGQTPYAVDSQFRRSRWHTRGWTLQELIAPRLVLFLARDWSLLGTKSGLVTLVEEVTGIEHGVLLNEIRPDEVSVARRMWWASRRTTTRVEDEAYSLLGLFGVHMSTIYGEGTHAFYRLQEQIMRTIPDQSLFVWGQCFQKSDRRPEAEQRLPVPERGYNPRYPYSLFAPSPAAFSSSSHTTKLCRSDFVARTGLPANSSFPKYTISSYGIRLRLFGYFPQTPKPTNTNTRVLNFTPHYVAILECVDEHGSLIALPFYKSERDETDKCSTGRWWAIPESVISQYQNSISLHNVDVGIWPSTPLVPLLYFGYDRQEHFALLPWCVRSLSTQGWNLALVNPGPAHGFDIILETRGTCIRLFLRRLSHGVKTGHTIRAICNGQTSDWYDSLYSHVLPAWTSRGSIRNLIIECVADQRGMGHGFRSYFPPILPLDDRPTHFDFSLMPRSRSTSAAFRTLRLSIFRHRSSEQDFRSYLLAVELLSTTSQKDPSLRLGGHPLPECPSLMFDLKVESMRRSRPGGTFIKSVIMISEPNR